MPTVILDIEGTVCPISFVKETLFPYFTNKVSDYLDTVSFPIDSSASELAKTLSGFPSEYTQSKDDLLNHIKQLVSNDVKDVNLKAFQGTVWKEGYEKGEIKAPVYPDAIELITSQDNKVYIYSSGSVPAQILLFKHVDVNGESKDLTSHISGYFDISTAGYKQEKASYEKIVKEIGEEASKLTFYSDVTKEIDAAIEAGLEAVVVARPGNAPLTEEDVQKYIIIQSFK
ncbi:hypothetical protein FT663_03064 [Candidozyma haemuli var. vulneris]|uniref:Enolase-phosphatase E1 n=1 Tax=Candidozyma haemuli TaxID=45357 RepID=A0A2V1B0S9_9ASCO|nr:2,3-diketo-5-methylthio-1-phosphopentane phosphatase [[Candida] haemuloni]KAF3988955.1 hypothetical protein FT662_03105 [[Candida] haemuloni var. vulneris]KAF3990737.1 hypothetical protein FT663_03064 [[Candida] haemuloni var. vulneris]PVH23519.1 2,3-diketo-5-methylthio-1-phosphopentane phosphatase [[Candida] haemuloni]